jgi:hypothetical protein
MIAAWWESVWCDVSEDCCLQGGTSGLLFDRTDKLYCYRTQTENIKHFEQRVVSEFNARTYSERTLAMRD